ncbi:MAG: hypothetical protein ILP18_08315 [Treponema sp.]|nr:hypothetical protein [Treponema sp.]
MSQIQALEILSLGSDDLREAIYREVQENPALIITRDGAAGNIRLRRSLDGQTRVSSSGTAGELESDRHQAALEAHADTRLPLQDYLLSQLHILNLTPVEMEIGERLIGNLDSRGFHILAPVSLLHRESPGEDEVTLQKLLSIVQGLDPPGCCCTNTEESLLVQARQRPEAPQLALFLLDGHFDFLNPPVVSSIVRKIKSFLEVQSTLFGAKMDPAWEEMLVDAEAVEEALAFIRTLDPFPARDYSTAETHYVSPDVYVEKLQDDDGSVKEDFGRGIVVQGGCIWQVRLASAGIPSVAVNPSYENYAEQDKSSVVNGGIRKAKDFIRALENRQDTLLRGTCMIVKRQHAFFKSGPGNLVPFTHKDVASVLGVHESTISRLASSKYLQCPWGLFALKFFFMAAVGSESGQTASRDKIKAEIEKIVREYKGEKKLSDQKISDMLAQRGFAVARRTVAKYRAEG